MYQHICKQCHVTFKHRTKAATYCSYACFAVYAQENGYWPQKSLTSAVTAAAITELWAKATHSRRGG